MQRDIRIDFARCVAALLVIYVHAAIEPVGLLENAGSASWVVATVLFGLGRTAVPIFIMLSGALVIGRDIPDWGQWMRRRVSATMKPYLFGAVLYLIWDKVQFNRHPASIIFYISQFVSGGAYFHLYFLQILLGSYVVTPFMQGLSKIGTGPLIGAAASCAVLVGLDRMLIGEGMSLGYLSFGNCMSYLPYFVLGYILYKRMNMPLRFAALGFAAFSLITILLPIVCFYSGNGFQPVDNYIQYSSPNVIAESICAFSLFLRVKIPKRAQSAVKFVAPLTLGIYVIHPAILYSGNLIIKNMVYISPLVKITAIPLFVYGVSAIIVWLLHKVPGVRGFI